MAKTDDKIELEGVISQTYPGGTFLVKLTTEGFEGYEIRARLSGRMRMHYIRIVPGDKVTVKVSPHGDFADTEGLITYRSR